jgi:hypothetical protein
MNLARRFNAGIKSGETLVALATAEQVAFQSSLTRRIAGVYRFLGFEKPG